MTCVADMETMLKETRFRTVPRVVRTTDASGNFLFTNAPAGSQVLLIDGPSTLYPGDLPVPVTIAPNVANTLSYPVYLHEVSRPRVRDGGALRS